MKIAFVSDNGTTISPHFGRARSFLVVTLVEGQEVAREMRAKDSCHGHAHHGSGDHHAAEEHDHDDRAHAEMLTAITDCQIVIAGGMGAGMDRRLRAAGLQTIRTRVREIDQALQTFLAGELHDMIELVH